MGATKFSADMGKDCPGRQHLLSFAVIFSNLRCYCRVQLQQMGRTGIQLAIEMELVSIAFCKLEQQANDHIVLTDVQIQTADDIKRVASLEKHLLYLQQELSKMQEKASSKASKKANGFGSTKVLPVNLTRISQQEVWIDETCQLLISAKARVAQAAATHETPKSTDLSVVSTPDAQVSSAGGGVEEVSSAYGS